MKKTIIFAILIILSTSLSSSATLNKEIVNLPLESFNITGFPWQINFRERENTTEYIPESGTSYNKTTNGNQTNFTWENLDTPAGTLNLTLLKTKISAQKLSFQLTANLKQSANMTIKEIFLTTEIRPKSPGKNETQAIQLPTFVGNHIYYNPYNKSPEKNYDYYPTWQFPFVLMFNEKNKNTNDLPPTINEGISWRVEDPEGKIPAMINEFSDGFVRVGLGINIQFNATQLTTPSIVIEKYSGAGYEGSLLYREWALNQYPMSEVPNVEDNSMIPQKLKDAPFLLNVGTSDGYFNETYFDEMYSHYQNISGEKNFATMIIGHSNSTEPRPELLATKMNGLNGLLNLTKRKGILTILYSNIGVWAERSIITLNAMAKDCDGNPKPNGTGGPDWGYAIEPHKPEMELLKRYLFSPLNETEAGNPNYTFDLEYFDHFNPSLHTTCEPIPGIENPNGTEAITGLQKLFDELVQSHPQGYGYPTEVLIDKFIKWAPMSASADGTICGLADYNLPATTYIYGDKTVRIEGFSLFGGTFYSDKTTRENLNKFEERVQTETLFNMVLKGKVPMITDIQFEGKDFWDIDTVPSFKNALTYYSNNLEKWKYYTRYGKHLQPLENITTLNISKETLGYEPGFQNCSTNTHPLILHGTYKYEKENEWAILLLNWNNHSAKKLDNISQEDNITLSKEEIPFKGTLNPEKYEIPVDGNHYLYEYNESTKNLTKLNKITGPIEINANISSLRVKLFIIKSESTATPESTPGSSSSGAGSSGGGTTIKKNNTNPSLQNQTKTSPANNTPSKKQNKTKTPTGGLLTGLTIANLKENPATITLIIILLAIIIYILFKLRKKFK